MSGVNIPTDSGHLSDLARSEMIEQYGGAVDSSFVKASIMRKMYNVMPIRGTDTKIVRRIGTSELQRVVPGVRPAANKTNFGRVGVTVDTVILARDNRSQLNEFQIDFNARAEIGKEHGKKLAKFFDEAFLIQSIKGARQTAPAGLNGAIGAGKVETLALANDELDPDLLYAKIARIIVRMQEEDLPVEESVIFVRPIQYEVLLNNDKLVNADFSADNGNYALGKVKTIMGLPLISTARMPNAAISNHLLSNDENGQAYDLSAAEAKAVAIVAHPNSLLVGETIPLESDVFYDKVERQWFIDSAMAFAVNTRRPDVLGVVDKA
jgi:hypothetical protein